MVTEFNPTWWLAFGKAWGRPSTPWMTSLCLVPSLGNRECNCLNFAQSVHAVSNSPCDPWSRRWYSGVNMTQGVVQQPLWWFLEPDNCVNPIETLWKLPNRTRIRIFQSGKKNETAFKREGKNDENVNAAKKEVFAKMTRMTTKTGMTTKTTNKDAEKVGLQLQTQES